MWRLSPYQMQQNSISAMPHVAIALFTTVAEPWNTKCAGLIMTSLPSLVEGKLQVEEKDEKFCKKHKETLVEVGTLLWIAGRARADVTMLVKHSPSEVQNILCATLLKL